MDQLAALITCAQNDFEWFKAFKEELCVNLKVVWYIHRGQITYNNQDFIKIIMMQMKKIIGYSPILARYAACLSTTRITFKDIAQSSYYKPIRRVGDFLNEQKIKHEEGPMTYRIRECIFCKQSH